MPTPFVTRLRDLDARATPGPWEWSANEDGYPTELTGIGVGVLRPGIAVSPTDGRLSAHITNDDGGAGPEHPDFALIVALRNAAPRIAALIEFAQRLANDKYADLGTGCAADDARVLIAALDKETP